MKRLRAQHLVVGSGAGGALTAARLAEAGQDVLVLEEGAWVDPDGVEMFSLEQMALQYRHAGVSPALGVPPVTYAEGCCVGGGTEVNSGLYHLAGEELVARWRAGWQVDGLTVDELERFSEEPRAALGVQPLPGPAPAASNVLRRGADALGWSALEVPRWYRYEGAAHTPVKQSMTRTYIPRAAAAGARVVPGVRVTRVVQRRGRAVGALAVGAAGERIRVDAEQVWVCGGAIATAALLQRSGVRRAGRTLSMHPTVKAVARFAEPLGAAEDVPVHQVKEFGADLSFGGSASRPGYLALALADDWATGRALMREPDRMAVYYAAIRPSGGGVVKALPGVRDPFVGFRLSRRDLRLLASGLARLAHLLLAAGAESVHPALPGGRPLRRAGDVAQLPAVLRRDAKLMTVHLFSSAPLGEDRAKCVTDSYGRVHGVDALRVNDASLLPSAPGINPQGTIMALAARNVAEHLAA
ncbi:MAG TPA: GMC family oxidoreductase N-terminal domain-containing protein [Baekduia sp.]